MPNPTPEALVALRRALEMAVRQNEHDMLLTGDELRECRDALAASKAEAAGGEAAGDGMLPDALVPHATEWYRLCERRFAVDRITISGELAEAIVEAIAALSAPAVAGAVPEEVREAVDEWNECQSPLEAQRAMFKISNALTLAAARQQEVR